MSPGPACYSAANPYNWECTMRFSGIIGAILVLGIMGGNVLLAEDALNFVYLPAFMVCLFGTLGLGYLSFGALDTLQAVSSVRLLVRKPGETAPNLQRRAEVVRGLMRHLWACGAAGSLVSLLKMLEFAAIQRVFEFNPNSVLLTALPLLYALGGCEFLLRPTALRLESLARGMDTE